ncbi:MAG TPA: hypothetical protein VH120_20925 [Gemmataceae bacterium]|jgi:hypothetical protein|nr:hypothetical protein [Gemmataceae bacterium]
MEAEPRGTDPAPIAGILRCEICGRTVDCAQLELFSFVRDGWPKCCSEVMILDLPGDKPGDNRSRRARSPVPTATKPPK